MLHELLGDYEYKNVQIYNKNIHFPSLKELRILV
jgi:hypothetical protein